MESGIAGWFTVVLRFVDVTAAIMWQAYTTWISGVLPGSAMSLMGVTRNAWFALFLFCWLTHENQAIVGISNVKFCHPVGLIE